jgi:hypothetical protein
MRVTQSTDQKIFVVPPIRHPSLNLSPAPRTWPRQYRWAGKEMRRTLSVTSWELRHLNVDGVALEWTRVEMPGNRRKT